MLISLEFPRWLISKESACHCRRCRFDPWVRKIPWRRKWQPTPVFLPGRILWTGEPGGLQSTGAQRVGTTQQLSTHRNYASMWILWALRLLSECREATLRPAFLVTERPGGTVPVPTEEEGTGTPTGRLTGLTQQLCGRKNIVTDWITRGPPPCHSRSAIHSPVVQAAGHHQEQGCPWH